MISEDFAKPKKAYSVWPKKKKLNIKKKDNYWKIQTEGTEVHQIIVIEK